MPCTPCARQARPRGALARAVTTTAAYVLGSLMLLPVPFVTARFFPAPDWASPTAWGVVAIQGILGAIAHVWW